MHDSLLQGIKFHLDHFNRHENTYFLAGWVYSEVGDIEALRIEALRQFNEEITQFEIRHDINQLYSLPENTATGFKCILSPEVEFSNLLISVRMAGEERFKVIQDVQNPHQQ